MSEVNDGPVPAKVQKLSSEGVSEPDPSLIDKTQKILSNIGSCQTKIDSLNEEASEEILKVEQKYNKLRRPHFEERNQLIEEIPDFWVATLINHPQVGSILAEEDVQCLHYLKQLSVEEFEDIKSGYKISFTFNKNPFFSNDVLTKEYHLSSFEGSPYTKSTPVYWNDNMDLTDRSKLSPRSRKRKRGQSSSFFSWYKSSTDPMSDELAEVLKDDIWPNPLQYYMRSPGINGVSDDSSDESEGGMDNSVVIVGDDDDDDEDDVYEVDNDDSDDDDLDDSHNLGLNGDSIQLVDTDDDDDDEVEVISDVEEIMDSSKDIGETTLDTTQDITADSILDDTAEDEILESTGDDILDDNVDDSILNDTADASIDTLDDTCGTSEDKSENDGAEKVTQELAEDGNVDSEVVKETSEAGSKNETEGGGEGNEVGGREGVSTFNGNWPFIYGQECK